MNPPCDDLLDTIEKIWGFDDIWAWLVSRHVDDLIEYAESQFEAIRQG